MGQRGFGLGLRPKHLPALLGAPAPGGPVDWLEVLTENFLGVGGRPKVELRRVRERYPVALHGVGLSIGSTDPLNGRYLARLAELIRDVDPWLVSDHLCWTSHRGANSHDLLPIPYTKETLALVAARVGQVQDHIGRRLHLENPSAYVAFAASEMDEADFLAELCRVTGCGLLLDVNNLYVNAQNLGVDAASYLATLDPATVGYFHLAGHTVTPEIRIDTHDEPVPTAVWDLYRHAVRRFPDAATLIEWDGRLPDFAVLVEELNKARRAREAAWVETPSRLCPASASRRTARDSVAWRELQDELWPHLTGCQAVKDDAPVLSRFDDATPASSLVGLNVYADAYHIRIADVAADHFPALVRVLGRTPFDRLITTFLKAHPPQEVSVKLAVAGLPAFLGRYGVPEAVGVPPRALADVAALEWASEDLFDAPDSPSPLPVAVLEEIAPEDWERVGFDFIAALRVVETEYDVVPVLDAVAEGIAPARPKLRRGAYAVFRAGLDVERRSLSVEEGRLLAMLSGGLTFREACDAVGGEDGEGETPLVERAAAALVRWMSWGLVHGIRI